jgi:hypothetical protein
MTYPALKIDVRPDPGAIPALTDTSAAADTTPVPDLLNIWQDIAR